MSSCSYCASVGKLTKEHIWPKSLITRNPDFLTYNKATNSLYKGEAVIKDVCANCNNSTLSKLDSYLTNLYDSHFANIVSAGSGVELPYDYNMLLRALLKISFNSARAHGSDKEIRTHQKLVKFILKGTHRGEVMLRLQIVTSSTEYRTPQEPPRTIKPELLRCAKIDYDGPLSHRYMIRLIAINSFWFYLIFPYKKEKPHKLKEFIDNFSNWRLQPGILIGPESSKVDIPVSNTTWFDPRLLGSLLEAKPQKTRLGL
ncbi:hypothetical protein [Pseudomonas putida]|uniref:Uncharacterized protein n=1 Tax=Pseudomonas putida TaxID=303 RepID=A0A9X8EFT9_PSEPU|nr:hypothetical protein [Pseudomonas putida]ROQ48187.1 hypothetical protein EDF85_3922 [Pseudomonas putida]